MWMGVLGYGCRLSLLHGFYVARHDTATNLKLQDTNQFRRRFHPLSFVSSSSFSRRPQNSTIEMLVSKLNTIHYSILTPSEGRVEATKPENVLCWW